jgi:hypothetical protein
MFLLYDGAEMFPYNHSIFSLSSKYSVWNISLFNIK